MIMDAVVFIFDLDLVKPFQLWAIAVTLFNG